MNILVISEHIRSDPFRSTFYNIDTTNKYYKKSIRRFIKGNNKFCYFINLFVTAFICRFKYKSWDTRLVISDNPRIGFLVSIINRITLCNIDHVIWNFNTQSAYTGIKLLIAKYACRSVSFIIVYSECERHLYSKMLNIPKSKILKKYLSGPYLDDDRYIELSKKSTRKDYVVSAGFSGRDYRFLSSVAAAIPEVHFVVITYPRVIRGIEFSPNVEIVSGISEIEYCRYIANSKLSFLPIENKITANGQVGIIQAMCFRTPLLTNLTEGTKDYLIPDVNSMIFRDGDVGDTVRCIKRLLSDDNYALQITENAYEFANEHFTIKHDIDSVHQIVDSIRNRFTSCDR